MSGDHPNYCLIKIGQNTEKSPGDLRRRCHSNSSEKRSANAGVKNSKKRSNNNNDNDISYQLTRKRELDIKVDFAVPSNLSEKEKINEIIVKYLDLARELKIAVDHEGDGNTNCNPCAWTSKAWKNDLWNWQAREELRPYRPQNYWDRQEYWEVTWRPEETCCQLNPLKDHQLKLVLKAQ